MDNEIIFEEYEEDLEPLFPPKSSYTFLVGPGISIYPPTNMPSVMVIVKSLLELCAPVEEVGNLLSLEKLNYELVVEKIQNEIDENLRFLDYLDEISEPNLIHFFLANAIIYGNYVITTNFDYMIEHALMQCLDKKWHKDIIPVITKEDFIFYQDPKNLINSGRYPIYKIHGSKRNIITKRDTKDSLITTISALEKERNEGKTFAIEPYKKQTVYNLMNKRTLVVIGYSGSDDFNMGPTLRELPFLGKIIWIEHIQENQTKIIHFKGEENIKKENNSHLEQLLKEISINGDFEIILIKTNTKNLIHLNLWRIFFPDSSIEEFIPIESKQKIQRFSEWIKPLYQDTSQIDKYKLATQLYFFLKEINATMRCSEIGLKKAMEVNDLSSKSYFLNFLGLINQVKGKYNTALKDYEESLKIDKLLGNLQRKTTVLNNIGSIYLTKGEYELALDKYQEALTLSEKIGDLSRTVVTLINIGRIYEIRNELDAALEIYKQALKITGEIGNLNRKALLLDNIGMIHSTKRENELALQHYEEALKITDQLGDLYGKLIIQNNIGRLFDESHNFKEAFERYNQTVQIAELLGYPSKKAGCINNIGSLYLAEGKQELALDKFKEALDIERKLGDPLMIITYLNNIGIIHNNRAEYNLALNVYREALKIATKIKDLSKKALFLTKIASIDMIQGNNSLAIEEYEQVILIFEELGEFSNKAASFSNLGKIYENFGNYNEAVNAYAEAFNIDDKIGDLFGKANDLYNLGRLFEIRTEFRRALLNFKESGKIFGQLGQEQYVNVINQKINDLNWKISNQ